MNMVDMVGMLGNLASSLSSVERLITAICYFSGIGLVIVGLNKLRQNTSSISQSDSPASSSFTFFVGGVLLFYVPTLIHFASNSVFGTSNILQYANFNPSDLYQSLGILIQSFGLWWFVRGCLLLIHSSKPGNTGGKKGLFYVIGGVLALNFTLTTSAISYIVTQLIQLSIVTHNTTPAQ